MSDSEIKYILKITATEEELEEFKKFWHEKTLFAQEVKYNKGLTNNYMCKPAVLDIIDSFIRTEKDKVVISVLDDLKYLIDNLPSHYFSLLDELEDNDDL